MSFREPLQPRRQNSRQNLDIGNNSTPLQTRIFNAPCTPYTPYGNRGLSLHRMQQPADVGTSKATKRLKLLLGVTWSIYHVSPLYNWGSKELELKRYGRCLKDKLTANLKDTDDFSFEAAYKTLPNLWLYDSDKGAFEVTVLKVNKSNISTVVYSGIFLSWGADSNIQLKKQNCQPLLLCRANSATIKKVHAEMERMHDCTISRFSLRDEDLHSLTVGIIANDVYHTHDTCKLEFAIRRQRKDGGFEIELPVRVISRFWSCIHGEDPSKWTRKEVRILWQEVYACTGQPLGLSLNKCILEQIFLPDVYLGKEKIRASTKEAMHCILSYLMGLPFVLESAAPSTGVQLD